MPMQDHILIVTEFLFLIKDEVFYQAFSKIDCSLSTFELPNAITIFSSLLNFNFISKT